MQMSATATLSVGTTVKDLVKMMEGIPDEAKVTINHYQGDRPWESGYSEIRFVWHTK